MMLLLHPREKSVREVNTALALSQLPMRCGFAEVFVTFDSAVGVAGNRWQMQHSTQVDVAAALIHAQTCVGEKARSAEIARLALAGAAAGKSKPREWHGTSATPDPRHVRSLLAEAALTQPS